MLYTHVATNAVGDVEEAPAGFCVPDWLSLEEALAVDAPRLSVTGAVGSGKTEFLIRAIKQLVDSGMAAERILFVAPSPDAAAAVRARLVALDARLEGVRVVTALDEALRVLGASSAASRVMLPIEVDCMHADLARRMPNPRTARVQLAAVYRHMAEEGALAEGDFSAELCPAVAALRGWLDATGGMLREEVVPRALAYLASDAGAPERGRYDAVLVDDAHDLPAATLRMLYAFDAARIVVAGNANEAHAAHAPAPLAGATAIRLAGALGKPAGITAFCDALCLQEGMDAAGASEPSVALGNAPAALVAAETDRDVIALKWRELEDEFDGLARIVRGIAGSGVVTDATDVVVAAPNRAWAAGMAKVLAKLHVPSVVSFEGDSVTGDPRRLEAAGTLAAYARLALAVDERDAVAWRLWLGLGDAHLRAAAWGAFEEWARACNLDVAEALARLASEVEACEPFPGATVLCARYQEGRAAAERLRQRTGFALAKAAAEGAAGSFAAMLEPIEGEETPAGLLERVMRRALEPAFTPGNRHVKIVSYGRLAGLNPRVLVMVGLVDGMAPSVGREARTAEDAGMRARSQAIYQRERRAFYAAAGKACETLYLSWPQRCEPALAKALGADVRRTRCEQGRTLAVLARSPFVDEAGNATPTTLSGEQYLGALKFEVHDALVGEAAVQTQP